MQGPIATQPNGPIPERMVAHEQFVPVQAIEDRQSILVRKQRKRVRLIQLTIGPYIANVSLLIAASQLGFIGAIDIVGYAVIAAGLIAGLFLIARSAAGAALDSGQFTMLQMLGASFPAAWALYHLHGPADRAAFLLTVLTPLLFGVTNLDTRRYAIVSAAYVLGYILVLASLQQWRPAQLDLGVDVLIGLALLLVTMQVAMLGGYIYRLRGDLRIRTIALANALDRISEMAHRDELTGLENRRALINALDAQVQASSTHGRPFSVCMLDIDHFKRVNDLWGHEAGDRALVRVGRCLRASVRTVDTVGRWGGEEFLVVMPDCAADGALEVAERVRAIIGTRQSSEDAADPPVTASIGVAQWQPGDGAADVVARADRALYAAKADGRDAVRVSTVR